MYDFLVPIQCGKESPKKMATPRMKIFRDDARSMNFRLDNPIAVTIPVKYQNGKITEVPTKETQYTCVICGCFKKKDVYAKATGGVSITCPDCHCRYRHTRTTLEYNILVSGGHLLCHQILYDIAQLHAKWAKVKLQYNWCVATT